MMESTFSWEFQQYFCVADVRRNCFWFWSLEVRTAYFNDIAISFTHIVSAASARLERKIRQRSQYLQHSGYGFLRLFVWFFFLIISFFPPTTALHAFFFPSSSAPRVFFGSWGTWWAWRVFPLYSTFFFFLLLVSKSALTFFNQKNPFFLLSHDSQMAEQIFCNLPRPIYRGGETERSLNVLE